MTDAQYQLFLECLDPALRNACKELSRDIPHALPRDLNGETQVQHVAKTLYDAVAADGDKPNVQLTEEQQVLINEGRDALLCALVSLIDEYLPQKDCEAESVAKLLSMEWRLPQANAKTPLYLVFEELATGMRHVKKGGEVVSVFSSFRRRSDGARPAMVKREDGTHGFTTDDDYSLTCFMHYVRCRDKLRAMEPKLNVELLIKYPLAPLAGEGASIFHISERLQIKREERTKMKNRDTRNMTTAMRVDMALKRYEYFVSCGCSYDLLQQMEINILANYVTNVELPEASRMQYLPELESIIDSAREGYGAEGAIAESHTPRDL